MGRRDGLPLGPLLLFLLLGSNQISYVGWAGRKGGGYVPLM